MAIQFIIGIGGSRSGSGKTSVACALIQRLKARGLKSGAVKFTPAPLYSSLVDDPAILGEEGKDTRRFLDAGAGAVLWAQSTPEDIEDVLQTALYRLSGLDCVMVEGNSAIEVLRPDIVIFISGGASTDREEAKESAVNILRMADLVLFDAGGPPAGAPARALKLRIGDMDVCAGWLLRKLAPGKTETVKAEIKDRLLKKAEGGRITCTLAREIADAAGVPYREVGRAADELRIKIINCELGCF